MWGTSHLRAANWNQKWTCQQTFDSAIPKTLNVNKLHIVCLEFRRICKARVRRDWDQACTLETYQSYHFHWIEPGCSEPGASRSSQIATCHLDFLVEIYFPRWPTVAKPLQTSGDFRGVLKWGIPLKCLVYCSL